MPSPGGTQPRSSSYLLTIVVTLCVSAIAYSGVMQFSRHRRRIAHENAAVGDQIETGATAGSAGFDLSQTAVPSAEIYAGGPPKDGIPALTDPKMIPANIAEYLRAEDRVIGVAVGDKARAYPLKILNLHEVVNDRIGGQAVAVTYCPLCDSAVVINRRQGDRVREFGVSGLLYNSNVLMFDRGSKVDSLWSQMMTEGVSGPAARKKLETLPLDLTTWVDWRTRYPTTKVLSVDTGHQRDYQQSPYDSYFANRQALMFPVNKASDRLPLKTPVLGIWTDDTARAYPLSAFDANRTQLEDELNGRRVTLIYNPAAKSLRVERADDGVQWVYSLWFAWYAFHSDTDVFAGTPHQ